MPFTLAPDAFPPTLAPARRLPILATVAALALVTSSCAVNPVTGDREISLMTESQEIQLGENSDESIVAQYGVLQDEEIANYVQSIGQRMVPVSHRPDLPFTFRTLDDPVVNAFALPGGFVYITRGILAYLNSEAALAGVIGHEIGHVTARHGVQRYTQQAILGAGLGLGSVLSETFANYADLAGQAAGLLLLKYGRDDERQSDRLGVEYATALGYDTTDMAEFFHTLHRLSPPDGRLPSWMSTHPDPGERWNTVRELTREEQSPSGEYTTNREHFLRTIDGLVFGTDPREGYFRGDLFVHPQLRFTFPTPSGWQRQNGKSQVVMVEPEQAAAVIFQAAPGGSASEAATAFTGQEGMTLVDRSNVTVAGNAGVRTVVRMPAEGGTQVVVSTFFGYGGGQWVFHGLTSEASYSAYAATLTGPADGFEPLSDPELMNVQPVRLKIVEAPRAGSFRQIAADHPIPENDLVGDLQGLAILNGVELDTPVQAGALIKILARE